MKWGYMDFDEKWEQFISYLKEKKFEYEFVKDINGIDADDEIIIDYNNRYYVLLYSGPDFTFRHKIEFKMENKEELKNKSKDLEKKYKHCKIIFREDGKDYENEMLIFIHLKIYNINDIKKYFNKYLNNIENIVNNILNI
jgi:hypothetical protein